MIRAWTFVRCLRCGWGWDEDDPNSEVCACLDKYGERKGVRRHSGPPVTGLLPGGEESKPDAEVIAHCPDDVRWLLDRVKLLTLACEAALGHAEALRMDTPEDDAVRLKLIETLQLALYSDVVRAALDTEQPPPGDTPFAMPPLEEIEKPLLRRREQP